MLALVGCADPTGEAPFDPDRCRPGPGTTGSPTTITEAVALMDALPRPASVECFVETLDRPLRIEATSSVTSAQPADGERSPRVFVFYESLVISLAIDGEGRDLVELSEVTHGHHTVKGELAFPLDDAPVTVTDAFEKVARVRASDGTTCGFCHLEEVASTRYPGGFTSLALKPIEGTLISVARLREEHATCDAQEEPDRCRYLDALVGHGPLEHQPFPEAYPTIAD